MTNLTRTAIGALTVLVLALAQFNAPVLAAAGGCSDPSTAEYTSRECKVSRLRQRSFAVIAVVDDGINPYNIDFRLSPSDDMVGIHPSEYIDGYPKNAQRLSLSFSAPSLTAAFERDASQWQLATESELSWVDGTSIIGGHSGSGGHFAMGGDHGTPAASLAAGRVFGPNHEDVLIVAVRGPEELDWAARQPWIDVITNSWTSSVTVAEVTRPAVADGKTVCFATGNLTVPLWAFESQGPSWHVNVGAEHYEERHKAYYSGTPADVLGMTNVQGADGASIDGSRLFGGTSGATPAVCGLIAHTISQARARMGDSVQGPRHGVVAVGRPGNGPSADGRLTRAEVEDAVFATARPSPLTPAAQYVRGGYGVIDRESVKHALKVLFGESPRPERPDEDRWVETTDAARNAVWGAPPPD